MLAHPLVLRNANRKWLGKPWTTEKANKLGLKKKSANNTKKEKARHLASRPDPDRYNGRFDDPTPQIPKRRPPRIKESEDSDAARNGGGDDLARINGEMRRVAAALDNDDDNSKNKEISGDFSIVGDVVVPLKGLALEEWKKARASLLLTLEQTPAEYEELEREIKEKEDSDAARNGGGEGASPHESKVAGNAKAMAKGESKQALLGKKIREQHKKEKAEQASRPVNHQPRPAVYQYPADVIKNYHETLPTNLARGLRPKLPHPSTYYFAPLEDRDLEQWKKARASLLLTSERTPEGYEALKRELFQPEYLKRGDEDDVFYGMARDRPRDIFIGLILDDGTEVVYRGDGEENFMLLVPTTREASTQPTTVPNSQPTDTAAADPAASQAATAAQAVSLGAVAVGSETVDRNLRALLDLSQNAAEQARALGNNSEAFSENDEGEFQQALAALHENFAVIVDLIARNNV